VARRLNEFAKTLPKDGVVAGAKATKPATATKAAKPAKAVKATKATKAPAKAAKSSRTLSPTRAVPKGALTANGKRRGRPAGSKNKSEPQNEAIAEVYHAHPEAEVPSFQEAEHAAI
jgi:hypothetical protein